MSATRTAKPRLLYTLPFSPPILFPKQPSYPIVAPTRDLSQAYSDALWPQGNSRQADEVVLDAFARLLLALLAERAPADLNALVRTLVVPLQDFDRRWRNLLPRAVEPRDEDGDEQPKTGPSGLSDVERAKLRGDYDRWAVEERARLEEEKRTRKNKMTKGKGKEKAPDQDEGMQGAGEEREDEDEDEIRVRPDDWLSGKELLETRLQALLLLTLLSLPATFQLDLPKKGRKKKNPEKYSDTLDPAMLLDFLTDRMQIWRVMKDVSDLDVAALGDTQEGEAAEKVQAEQERDTMQKWWQDVVEPLYRTHVESSVLGHHRLKLFPAPSQAERVAQRLVPAPSPFKTRSLISLERSARRRDAQEGQKLVAESPTMKRLMSMPSLGGGGKVKTSEPKDVFKVPGMALKRKESLEGSAAEPPKEATRPRSRKQERPRPLPRGGSNAGAKDVLKRREVSLSKKANSTVGLKKKVETKEAESEVEGDGRKRKRKSVSQKKLAAPVCAAPTSTLVPDTPSRSTSSQPNGRKPFSRATSLPSFAALGAAFRAGASDSLLPIPFSLRSKAELMDLEEEDEPRSGSMGPPSGDGDAAESEWLDGREEDWRRKGGREGQSSYNGDEEEGDQQQPQGLATPKGAKQALLVPDT
ncbi:hypothetical protein JCM8547_000993 [Rhodosporidiobolus lusitaniae]